MTNRIDDISLRKAALVAGFGYLPVFILGGFANFPNFIVPGDAATTVNNIMASESLFRTYIASWVIVLAFDTLVAWALYILLKPVHKSLSLLAAWFRLVFVAIFGIALVNLLSVLPLLSGADYLTVFEPNQLQAQAMSFVNAYTFGVNISFVFFGLHIFFLGYLIYKSDYIPRILGVLLIVASIGYFIDSFASILSSNYASNEIYFIMFIAVPAIISELSLTLWLIFKGRKIPELKS